MADGILETSGIDIAKHTTAKSLFTAIAAKGKTPNPNATRGKLIDFLLSEYL